MSPALLADIVLLVHVAFIAFVVVGQLLIMVGGVAGWHWVRQRWFRLAHLGAIGLVVVQAWLGVTCPLTIWENNLRRQAGQGAYEIGFIADHVQRWVFFSAPAWVFVVCYSVFGLLVLSSLWFIKPDWHPAGGRNRADRR